MPRKTPTEPSLFDITPSQLLQMARSMTEQPQRDLISSYHMVVAYLHLQHGNPRQEVFRVLFMDRKNRLILDKVMGTGTIDHVPVYPREIMREALLCDASAIILCHNHPSGDPTPSQQDVKMTREIKAACEIMGITLHDHIVLGAGKETSMRANGDL